MSKETNLYIVRQLNQGLRTDMARLNAMDATLQNLVNQAKSFIETSRLSEWAALDGLLAEIRDRAARIDAALQSVSGEPQRDWDVIMQRDLSMQEVIGQLQQQGVSLLSKEQARQWADLWQIIRLHLESLRAHAATSQARLELRRRYGKEKADRMTEEIVGRLPESAAVGNIQDHVMQYGEALDEFEKNRESTGGFFGIFKSLFLVQNDTPDRILRRRTGDNPVA